MSIKLRERIADNAFRPFDEDAELEAAYEDRYFVLIHGINVVAVLMFFSAVVMLVLGYISMQATYILMGLFVITKAICISRLVKGQLYNMAMNDGILVIIGIVAMLFI